MYIVTSVDPDRSPPTRRKSLHPKAWLPMARPFLGALALDRNRSLGRSPTGHPADPLRGSCPPVRRSDDADVARVLRRSRDSTPPAPPAEPSSAQPRSGPEPTARIPDEGRVRITGALKARLAFTNRRLSRRRRGPDVSPTRSIAGWAPIGRRSGAQCIEPPHVVPSLRRKERPSTSYHAVRPASVWGLIAERGGLSRGRSGRSRPRPSRDPRENLLFAYHGAIAKSDRYGHDLLRRSSASSWARSPTGTRC